MKNSISSWARALAVLTLATTITACSKSSHKKRENTIKYEIRVMKPESRVYNIYIPASLHGVTEVEVYPQVSGIIREVNFKDGIKVTKGQTLFVIDQTGHKLQVQNAQANLAAAKAQMETTKLQYESNQKLAEKRIISDYVLSTSMNAYHVAQAAVQQAEAQLAMAQTNLGYCTVKSPITGIIKENGFKMGELADPAELLCKVSDNSEVEAWFSYTESQLLDMLDRYNLKPTSEGLTDIDGKTASAKMPHLQLQLKNGQMYKHEGVVTEIGGIVDRKTGTVICKVTCEGCAFTCATKGILPQPRRRVALRTVCHTGLPHQDGQRVPHSQDGSRTPSEPTALLPREGGRDGGGRHLRGNPIEQRHELLRKERPEERRRSGHQRRAELV